MIELPNYRFIRAKLTGQNVELPTAMELNNFMYDFNMLYEVYGYAINPENNDKPFSQWLYRRNSRRVSPEDRLRVVRFNMESPAEFVTIVGASALAFTALMGVGAAYLDIAKKNLEIRGQELLNEGFEIDNQSKRVKLRMDQYSLRNHENNNHIQIVPVRTIDERSGSQVERDVPVNLEVLRNRLRLTGADVAERQIKNRINKATIRPASLEIDELI